MLSRSLVLGVVAGCAALAACSQDYPTLSSSQQKEQFTANLTPRTGVTSGTATATLTFQDTSTIRFEVLGTGLTGVNRIQLQAGTAADTGRVMATLFTTTTAVNVDSNRVVRQGEISRTGTTFAAPFTFDSVASRIRGGTAFVLIRTTANPTGALRGQLTRMP